MNTEMKIMENNNRIRNSHPLNRQSRQRQRNHLPRPPRLNLLHKKQRLKQQQWNLRRENRLHRNSSRNLQVSLNKLTKTNLKKSLNKMKIIGIEEAEAALAAFL
jgi:hypothetical protein